MMRMEPSLHGTASTQFHHEGKVLNLIKESSSSQQLTSTELQRLNDKLSRMSLDAVLLWAHDTFGSKLIDVTSFGYSGMVLLHKLHALKLNDIPILTIDTLHLFPETYQFIQRVKDEFPKLHIHTYRPQNYTTRDEFDYAFGTEYWKTHPDQYNYLSKVEPTLRGLQELKARAWITGRRRDQGGERGQLAILEWTDDGQYKLNPLAYWSQADVWKYIRSYKVPYNPLFQKGYQSVGDVMTTQTVEGDAPERSGRFVGMKGRTECGIHSTRKKIEQMKHQAESLGNMEEQLPTLPCPKCDYELTPSNFEEIVIQKKKDNPSSLLLLEFYSPLCGACQDFAPKFKQIMEKLEQQQEGKIEIARFDVTYHDVPKDVANQHGITVEGTPDLYLIHHPTNDDDGSIQIQHYEGEKEVDPLLQWIKEKSALK
eukprot:CAMPEP_0178916056 /NCGR_PEP_ID=MMETSP0786-20121207/12404_1 /TAXON_ID=186022 /ORGANISM="Thalassionema frauenfeldii, Strain CCMP 1798" /LENGTH=425 /DNA_ID=CAMNT_0020589303 /DNA_START=210 /DNA_END=1487 /DNA_ORIENTATION=+